MQYIPSRKIFLSPLVDWLEVTVRDGESVCVCLYECVDVRVCLRVFVRAWAHVHMPSPANTCTHTHAQHTHTHKPAVRSLANRGNHTLAGDTVGMS